MTPTEGTVRLLAFAGARDIIGAPEVGLPVVGPCDVAELWSVLLSRFPALEPYKRSIRLAVNGAYASDADRIAPGDEVALIPPVAGG
jgi:molybdopterin converting factor small subunit